jgi:hypothetical protein
MGKFENGFLHLLIFKFSNFQIIIRHGKSSFKERENERC